MTAEADFCGAEFLPHNAKNGAGQNSTKTVTLPRICPARFSVGQNTTIALKINEKMSCPARGKVAGQNAANHSAPPHGSLYRRARRGKMGQTGGMK